MRAHACFLHVTHTLIDPTLGGGTPDLYVGGGGGGAAPLAPLVPRHCASRGTKHGKNPGLGLQSECPMQKSVVKFSDF